MNKINILCSTDDNYVPYCGIMLTSLFENNKDLNLEVYLMCESLNEKNLNDLNLLSKKYGVNIQMIHMDNSIFKNCPIRPNDHVSLVTYYRLVAADVLPEEVDKILYLDCDMIVNGSIKNLYNTDISEYAFGAVIDEDVFNDEKYSRLNYKKSYKYINAGVIIFNLEYWKKHNIAKECFEYISKYPDRIKLHDQDTINVVCRKQKKLLPIVYNFQTGFLLTDLNFSKSVEEEIKSSSKSPVIIHYTGKNKPWMRYSQQPFRNLFFKYKKQSLWNKLPLIKNLNAKKIIRYYIYHFILLIKNKRKYRRY